MDGAQLFLSGQYLLSFLSGETGIGLEDRVVRRSGKDHAARQIGRVCGDGKMLRAVDEELEKDSPAGRNHEIDSPRKPLLPAKNPLAIGIQLGRIRQSLDLSVII